MKENKDIRIIQTLWSGGHDPLECGYGIYQNDKLFCSIPISSNGLPRDMIYAKGHVPVGQCEVALPKTGSVTVTITMGALYEDGSGRFARNTSYSKIIN